jgi:hypothetical protein
LAARSTWGATRVGNGLLGRAVVKYVVGLGGLQRDGSLFALPGWLDRCIEDQR